MRTLPRNATSRTMQFVHRRDRFAGRELVEARARAFTDELADLPAARWVEIGRSLASDTAKLPDRTMAWNALEAAIAQHRLAVSAWYARDAVETMAGQTDRASNGGAGSQRVIERLRRLS